MQHQNYLKITALLIMNLIPHQSIFGSTGEHVDYVVMGKSVNYRQKNNENLILLNTVFFAEIFPLKTSGSFFTTGSATFIFFIMAIIVSLSKKHSN